MRQKLVLPEKEKLLIVCLPPFRKEKKRSQTPPTADFSEAWITTHTPTEVSN